LDGRKTKVERYYERMRRPSENHEGTNMGAL